MVTCRPSPVAGSRAYRITSRSLTDMAGWTFEITVSENAAALLRRKGGTVALDFIPPIS